MNAIVAGLFSLLPVFSVPFMLVLFRDRSVWPALLLYHALCWSVPFLLGQSWKAAGFVSGNVAQWFRRTLILSMVLLVAGELAHYLVMTHRLDAWWEPVYALAGEWKIYVIYNLLLNPVSEEFYWRGFLLKGMGVVRNAWLFWLMHAAALVVFLDPVKAIWYTAPTFAFGLLCAWMRREYQTLWPCILLHIAADAAILRAAS